jgi:hypothetical protein
LDTATPIVSETGTRFDSRFFYKQQMESAEQKRIEEK